MKLLKPIIIALGCALLLAITAELTRERIAANEADYELRLLRDMVPDTQIRAISDTQYVAEQAQKTLATITRTETLKGYNGRISVLIAISNDQEIIDVRTTYHKETPGLGDYIDLEVSDWMLQFRGRSAQNTLWQLKPEGDIDGVSGATITARATLGIIAESLP